MCRLLQFAFSLAVLLPAVGQAQEARVTGRVIDAVTQKPVPFASLNLLEGGTGALSNEYGYFQLGEEDNRPDSLVVASLGFYRRAVFVAPGKAHDLLVKLNHQPITFISCPVVSRKIDWPLFKDGRILGAPNAQYAFFLKNETPQSLGVIWSISLYIGERGFPREPFRLHLYKTDDTTGAPGADLLPDRRMLSARRDERWYTIDLTDDMLTLPRKGIFIALEFPDGSDSYSTDLVEDYIPAGHFIYPSKESNSWSHTPGKGWKVLSLNDNGLRRYRTLIKAEIVGVKKNPLPLSH